MKILLTGANGQLGNAFKDFFLENNIEYIATDIDELDITDLLAIRNFIKINEDISIIINCAAYNNVDKAEEDKKTAFLINAMAPKNLAIASNECNIPIVHYSTDYVFDGTKGEEYYIYDQPNPISEYGRSKYLGEQYVQTMNPKHIVIRTSWLFGNGPINFIKKLLSWAKKEEISIVNDEISSPTYAPDLAVMSWQLIKSKAYGIFHISNDGICSRYDWAKYILSEIHWKGTINAASLKDFNLAAQRPGYSKIDNFGLEFYSKHRMRNWKEATSEYLNKIKG
ncbi:MAG: dTDP-4-dehydrorhamnose reductase [Candidatus Heimdallarchaeota archaeon]|nr:dTDP-4-dehydrorhamnose reductase [Candidatus Heimdallarchaeota archaeon]